eukprot:3194102-Amphidinium_carterae.1
MSGALAIIMLIVSATQCDLWPVEETQLQTANCRLELKEANEAGKRTTYLAAVEKAFDNLTEAEVIEHHDRLLEAKMKEWKSLFDL